MIRCSVHGEILYMPYIGDNDRPLIGRLSKIPDGDAGTEETVRQIARKIHEATVDPYINRAAIEIVKDVPEKDYIGEIVTLFEYVRDEIRYVKDIHEVEVLRSAKRTLDFQSGDCDDKVILLSSLLLTIGHGPVRLVVIAADHDRPEEYSHIYLEVQYYDKKSGKDKWLALDPIVQKPAGWAAPKPYRRMEVELRRD